MKRSELARAYMDVCGQVWTSSHGKRLMEILGYDIGPRPAASNAMRSAQEFLGNELHQLGASEVHTQEFPLLAWRDAPSLVQLTSPRDRAYESIQHVHSAAAAVSGPLVYAGFATKDDLDRSGKKLKDAIALVCGAEISGSKYTPPPQKIRYLCERGVVGVLVKNMSGVFGAPAANMASVVGDATIPVAGISYEAAQELLALIRNGQPRMRMETTGKSYRSMCLNLIGELGPARARDEVIVLSAHLDTHFGIPGALDNLSGVVTLMEMARSLAKFRHKFKRTLRLIIFGAEEHYFMGSRAYVRDNPEELDRIKFVFNMDGLFHATAKGVAVMWSPSLRDYIDRAFLDTQCEVDVRNLFCMSSDYFPFMLEGIAAARPAHFLSTEIYPPWSHTRQDTPDKIPIDWIRQNAMTFSQLLLRMLTDSRPLPVKRKTREQVKALVAEENVIESLKVLEFDG